MKEKYSIAELFKQLDALRNPVTGCPWNLQQDFASLAKFSLEEAYELVDAIDNNDINGLQGELGDLLYQVIYHSKLAEEQGLFSFSDVVAQLQAKLVRRHPHVFEEIKLQSEAEIIANWQQLKAEERLSAHADSTMVSALDNIPLALPSLVRAYKIQQRAALQNFDFDNYKQALSKVYEEVDEVVAEVEDAPDGVVDEDKLADELGDLLFSVVNVSRHLGQDPEQALRRANQKFEKRFKQVEVLSLQSGKSLSDCSIEEMELFWQKVK